MFVSFQRYDTGATAVDTLNLTAYLDNDSDIVLTQELERDAFERVVDDVHFKVSNMAGTMSARFNAGNSQSKYRIAIVEESPAPGRVLFVGEIDQQSIEFDVNTEWCEFDAFSINRIFWDRAKTTKIIPAKTEYDAAQTSVYTTVDHILRRELITLHTTFTDLFGELDISDYATRPIKSGWFVNTTTPSVTFRGQYKDLDADTTIEQLLKAMGIYYNAEFFISPETLKFTMKQRGTIISDKQTDVDAVLKDDAPVKVVWQDDKKMDYIHTFFEVTPPEKPVLYNITPSNKTQGFPRNATVRYLITATLGARDVGGVLTGNLFETTASDIVEITVPDRIAGTIFPYWSIFLTIPACQYADTVRRRLYRKYRYQYEGEWVENAGYLLIQDIDGNTSTVLEDYNWPPFESFTSPPLGRRSAGAWMRYDESTDTWSDPILDVGDKSAPAGKIFDIQPQLRFYTWSIHDYLFEYDPFDIWCFFGQEGSIAAYDTFRLQWKDMFRTRRKVNIKVQGLGFRVGDSCVSKNKLFPNDLTFDERMVVKRAANNLIKEETELELITV